MAALWNKNTRSPAVRGVTVDEKRSENGEVIDLHVKVWRRFITFVALEVQSSSDLPFKARTEVVFMIVVLHV